MREAEPDRVDDATPIQIVQVGKITAAGPVPLRDGVVDRTAPACHCLGRIVGKRYVLQPLGDPDVVLVGHPPHPGAKGPHEMQARFDDGVHGRCFPGVRRRQ